ncbi:MAG: hypothetical protein ABIT70_06995 [Sulfuriferula sp.]
MNFIMLRPKSVYTLVVACCLLIPATLRAETGCTIVYGQNWSFLFSAPKKWETACPVNDQSGVVVALWPKGTPWTNAPGVMYVTVSDKDGFTLEQFAEDELARFRVQSPRLQIQILEPVSLQNKSKALVRKLSGDQYGSHELVAYADAGNVYLIVVLTSQTQQAFERLRPAFDEFVSSVTPMKIEFHDVEKTPNTVKRGAPPREHPSP